MKRIAILHLSKEGQAARIANRIAGNLRSRENLRVTTRSIREIHGEIDWSAYDGIVIGGSVHLGHHAGELVEFVRLHLSELNRLPNAFFSVSLSAAGGPEQQDDARRLLDDFIAETGWMPGQLGIFAGALKYRSYNIFTRWIMKRIAGKAGGDTDTSRDYEYTDWNRVNAFAQEFYCNHFMASRVPTKIESK